MYVQKQLIMAGTYFTDTLACDSVTLAIEVTGSVTVAWPAYRSTPPGSRACHLSSLYLTVRA